MPKMTQCIIRNCKKRSDRDKGVKFHAIPSEKRTGPLYSRQRSLRRRLLWVARINKEGFTIDKIKAHMRVCGHHFIAGSPSKTSDETNPDWAPSLHLGYTLLPTSSADVTPAIKPEPNQSHGTEEAKLQNNSEVSNTIPSSPLIKIKEEVLSYDDYSCDEKELKMDPSILDQEYKVESLVIEDGIQKKAVAVDLVRVSIVDSSEGTGTGPGVSFVNKEEELFELKKVHSDLMDKHTSLQKVHAELQREHAELKKYYNRLRDKLTDAEVDKLELNAELVRHMDSSEKFSQEAAALQAESALHLGKIESYEKEICQLQIQLQESEDKRGDLKDKLDNAFKCGLTSELLKTDNLLLECFTGLPCYSMMEVILSHVAPYIKETSKNVLVPWECLFLTLMRLKLSLKLQKLGDRFDVSSSTVHKVFERWVHYLYKGLGVFIKWPENKSYLKSTPTFFKKAFEDTSVFIVECVEVYAGRPGKLDGDYSNNRSVKFLLAFTPDGKVVFVSNEWDGKLSDVYVTVNSGFYEKLSTGDIIMANHGFPIGENNGFYCGKVIVQHPPSFEIKLEPHNIHERDKPLAFQEYVRNLSKVITKKFSILQSALPWEMFATKQGHDVNQVEEVINVCCALSNLSRS